MRRRLFWLIALLTLLLYCGVTFTIMLDEKPAARNVIRSVYGERPLGLPWQVVHTAAFALLFAPLPALMLGLVRLFAGSRRIGRPVSGLLSFVAHYRTLSADPELRPHVRRVAVLSLGYLSLAVGWIAYTAAKGI